MCLRKGKNFMEALPAIILADRISFLIANMAVRCY